MHYVQFFNCVVVVSFFWFRFVFFFLLKTLKLKQQKAVVYVAPVPSMLSEFLMLLFRLNSMRRRMKEERERDLSG